MSNKRRNRRTAKGARRSALGRARAQTKLSANVTEEQDWYLDTPDVRLSRIFSIVLILHAIAIGGMMAFKMVDKASAETGIKISSARQTYDDAVQEQRALAVLVPSDSQNRVEDVARVAPPTPLRQDPNNKFQYKVQAGDTLPEIARSLNVSADALRKENSIISDNELYPGRWLNLPQKEAVALATPVEAPAQPQVDRPTAPARPTTYTVKSGDTAWAISRQLGVSFNELMQLNGIDSPETLQIDQVLRVPSGN